MKRRKGFERVMAITLAAFLSFTTIANDCMMVNAEETSSTSTTTTNTEGNGTGTQPGDKAD